MTSIEYQAVVEIGTARDGGDVINRRFRSAGQLRAVTNACVLCIKAPCFGFCYGCLRIKVSPNFFYAQVIEPLSPTDGEEELSSLWAVCFLLVLVLLGVADELADAVRDLFLCALRELF